MASIQSFPAAIRQRIYHHLRLDRPGRAVVRGTRHVHKQRLEDQDFSASTDNNDVPIVLSMLLTCRMFYDEVRQLVYSRTQFCIVVRSPSDFQFLSTLRSGTARHLTQVVIDLSVTNSPVASRTDVYPHQCQWPYDLDDRNSLDNESLRTRESSELLAETSILDEWQSVMSRLSVGLKAKHLHLSLVCDTASYGTAARAVEPLLSLEGSLAACAVRLSGIRDSKLQQLAESAVYRATKEFKPEGTFKYLGLPAEVRRSILSYTDLVLPMRQVSWRSSRGFFAYYCAPCDTDAYDSDPLPYEFHYACRFRYCCNVTCCDGRPNGIYGGGCFWSYTASEELDRGSGCFCRRYHSAFSNPQKCRCWEPPTALFLVCQMMRTDAEIVFFGSNRLIIGPPTIFWPRRTPGKLPSSSRFEASIFLASLRPPALAALRCLELVFDVYRIHHGPGDDPLLQDWTSTLQSVQHLLTQDRLSIRVLFIDYSKLERLAGYTHTTGDPTVQQADEKVASACATVLSPLANLKHLHLLQLHIARPLHQADDPQDASGSMHTLDLDSAVIDYVSARKSGLCTITRTGDSSSQWQIQADLFGKQY